MKLFGRFLKGKEGGKCPLSGYEVQILRLAEHYHKLPEEIENMDSFWLSRSLTLLYGESEKNKLK